MLARFTQIDYDRDMALVAFAVEDGKVIEKMLGVSRLMGDPDGKRLRLYDLQDRTIQSIQIGNRPEIHIKGFVRIGNFCQAVQKPLEQRPEV